MRISISKINNAELDNIRILQPEGWSDILTVFKFYCTSDFCFPFVLNINNEIAGSGCAIILDRTAWLGHIIVHPKYRRNGFGSMIVSHLINFLKEKNIQTVSLIASDEGFSMYQKYGFVKTEEYLSFERNSENKLQTPDCGIIPFNEKYRDEIYSLDATASGENRTKVLQNQLSESFICTRNGSLSGYFIPSLGEGLITAINAETGISLLKYKNPKRITVPETNTPAINYALSQGFEKRERLHRMVFGKHLNRRPEYIYSRISGYFG
ncbi:MAG TPA: GNAT family N-acetyltransferase [Spirochaetota bacterium]|nr:GNAT family N-acetyltransferase [Spirochaetota bacterium]HOR44087.1 GNAT family N-acetyltransferase [Spirochaetota bacterium]HOU84471.1 GNAT family N-acetyltransferase [Spirochaetota bacterium]HPK56217.1 GNAT family N-acetyltransferase [Spirochaetota bacterium]HQE58660.1 GNAT family N-acetyltransferase [Spirochaetota bacterium]